MSGSKGDYLETAVLNHVLRATALPSPAAVYVALYTVAPTDAGGGTETTYGGYARVTTSGATWNAASGGSVTNAAAIACPACTSGTATIVAFGGYDASSGGNLLWYGSCSLSVSTGITPQFAIGALTITQT